MTSPTTDDRAWTIRKQTNDGSFLSTVLGSIYGENTTEIRVVPERVADQLRALLEAQMDDFNEAVGRVEVLERALGFYASGFNYAHPSDGGQSPAERDGGELAREVMAGGLVNETKGNDDGNA